MLLAACYKVPCVLYCTTTVKSFVFGLTYESFSVQRKFLRDLQKPGEPLLKTILKITSLTS